MLWPLGCAVRRQALPGQERTRVRLQRTEAWLDDNARAVAGRLVGAGLLLRRRSCWVG